MKSLIPKKEYSKKEAITLINMRTVYDLVAVECIFELYNRYESSINNIRFNNIDLYWFEGTVKSYAPFQEWDNIKEHISKRFLVLDLDLVKNLITLYLRTRRDSRSFIKSFFKHQIEKYTDFELANLLEKYQSLVFGDLYRLNFVQVEHGLSGAIKSFLGDNYEESLVAESQQTISEFVFITAAGRENLSLKKKAMFIKMIRLLGNKFLADKVHSFLLERHYKEFSHLYCGYGELPKSKYFFEQRINEECVKKFSLLNFLKTFILYSYVVNIISNINSSLKIFFRTKSFHLLLLVLLQFFGGKFRDKNKELLGTSTVVRLCILDEIARRGFETRENLRFYLFEEIYRLVTESKHLKSDLINMRKLKGVCFKRRNTISVSEDLSNRENLVDKAFTENVFGVCASRGFASGACKVIFSKDDIKKINDGDIMVAIGTDFDLIEGMYRAAAIVTEEGGILSHAAVICRELKKPCVIGVKNATSILTDNVVVQVYADEGKIQSIKDY